MKYNKLVRDRIPEIIKRNGQISRTRIASEDEQLNLLEKKLQEEVVEFLEGINPEELADIIEVVYALGKSLGVTYEELESIRKKKREERGGFEQVIVLLESGSLDEMYPPEVLNSKVDFDQLEYYSNGLGTSQRIFRAFGGSPTNKDLLELYHRLDWEKLFSQSPKYLKSAITARRGLGVSSLASIHKYLTERVLPKT